MGLIDWVRRVQGSGPAIDFAGRRELDALGQSLENVCRRLHARYVRERPILAAICDRVTARRPDEPATGLSRRAG